MLLQYGSNVISRNGFFFVVDQMNKKNHPKNIKLGLLFQKFESETSRLCSWYICMYIVLF